MVALVTNLERGGQGKGANTEEEGKGWSRERDKGEKRRGHEEKQEETCPQSTMEHREEKSKGQARLALLVERGSDILILVEDGHDLAGEVEGNNAFVGVTRRAVSRRHSRVGQHPTRDERQPVQETAPSHSRCGIRRRGGVGGVHIWLLEMGVHLVGPLDGLLHCVDIDSKGRDHDRLEVLLTAAGQETVERDPGEGPPGVLQELSDTTDAPTQALL
jgi:hypothetical protein